MKTTNLFPLMKLSPFILFFILIPLLSCSEQDSGNSPYYCETLPLENNFSRLQLLHSYDPVILQAVAGADVPNAEGALSRNKNGYFHVRFQMAITPLSDFAVASENIQALDYAMQAIEYSFAHQLTDGNFELVIPPEFSNYNPNEGDIANAVSFFLASLGVALNDCEQSNWYNSPELIDYKNRIETLQPQIALAANWLLTQKQILETADAQAPNRLFFDAAAFYGLGKWLQNEELKSVGNSFIQKAVAMKTAQGYFLENNGWDSSYQGVALFVGFNLYSIMDSNNTLKSQLWDCLCCAANWQKNRVLASGEISTEGNTRVYPGGESFLGNEKQVDWLKTLMAMYDMGYYSGDNSYLDTALRIQEYYLN